MQRLYTIPRRYAHECRRKGQNSFSRAQNCSSLLVQNIRICIETPSGFSNNKNFHGKRQMPRASAVLTIIIFRLGCAQETRVHHIFATIVPTNVPRRCDPLRPKTFATSCTRSISCMSCIRLLFVIYIRTLPCTIPQDVNVSNTIQ